MVDSAVKIRLGLFFLLGFWASVAEAQVDSLFIQKGTASYYGRKFHGKRTFSGEVFSMDSLTAAHKRLPMGTLVRVINQKNDLAVVVRINDRLPSYSKRQIDISRAAATRIEMIQDGLAKVRIEAVDLKELDRLVEYYSDKEHPGLRIRPYYQGIEILKRELNLNLVHYTPDCIKIFPSDFQLVKN
ncbi:septal ring lytic transglycosylase RlpA family protein [Algoriphagus sp.]|uniref:septal ring lytic transglycosylase RlpA family protein n=1 Tax=Algoriphagus sp. TaxID=1872435 RepID=UPI0027256529|nr:septal ring lytic transglycosylase RlpA family protein [Algoriphagus sp.]MDO8968893.1 septal ring lytic transglycosylase RlpA family protein [Algoriphagus sp.]MDP3201338.1 septal ring lytic transglycosylase RlpA family protein [Algoriphagus sp.]